MDITTTSMAVVHIRVATLQFCPVLNLLCVRCGIVNVAALHEDDTKYEV